MKKLILLSVLSFSTSSFALTVKEAKKTLAPFKKELMGTLMTKMKEAGPVAALETCKLKAMPITQKHATGFVGMGRTSHKVRNPDNAPKDWVKPYLAQFKSGEIKKAMTIDLKNGHTGYLEPIYIQPKCLICHGSNLSKGIEASLKEKYPQDKARGFKNGEFRGLFWIESKK